MKKAKGNRVLSREHAGHSKHPLPTILEKNLHMDITRWSIPKSDWLYSLQPKMEKLYTARRNRTGSWLWLRSWTAYCKIKTSIEASREKHKTIQVWPKSNPSQLYSENDKQIQGIRSDRQSAWRTMVGGSWRCTETGIKTIPMEKKWKKAICLFDEALQIVEKRRQVKGIGEKERYTHLNAEFQRIARRDKKDSKWSMQRNRGKQ